MLRANRATQSRTLEILKTRGEVLMQIDRIRALPVGVPTVEAKEVAIPPFAIQAGARLDLSAYWEVLTAGKLQPSLLKSGKDFDWITVNARCSNRQPEAVGLRSMSIAALKNLFRIGRGKVPGFDLESGGG